MLFFDEPTKQNGFLSHRYSADFFLDGELFETVAAYLTYKKEKMADGEAFRAMLPYMLYEANRAKFWQNESLLTMLLTTGRETLAAALPDDAVLGTGAMMGEETFNGRNLLGFSLMAVRNYACALQKENKCRVYFGITGHFRPEEIGPLFGLTPERAWHDTDRRPDGKPYGFSFWQAPAATAYSPYTEEQMEAALAPFFGKEEILCSLRRRFDVSFTLAVVPRLAVRKITPALAPSARVIAFCQRTGTQLDIDLYLSE